MSTGTDVPVAVPIYFEFVNLNTSLVTWNAKQSNFILNMISGQF